MKKSIRILLSCFIPFKELRHKIKNGYQERILGCNNNIMVIDQVGGGARPATKKELATFNICITGNNNTICIPKNACEYKITVYGNNNRVNCYSEERAIFNIMFGDKHTLINNAICTIENGVMSNGCTIFQYENNSSVIIKKNSMFSWGVELWATDTHSIFNLNDKNTPINIGKEIYIGEHVWICKGVTILKNTYIANDSIIGCNSTVSGKYDKTNCIIAGNPAKIVKENIYWDSKRINDCIYNED